MSKISIIIPVYNTGKPLIRCIKSIQKQKMIDFECLLIDDKSDDRITTAIIQLIITNDNRFKLITNKTNEGIEKTRLIGIANAKGKYIIFSDHDDYYEKNAFEKLLEEIEKNKADVVISNYYLQRFSKLKIRKKQKSIKNDIVINRDEFIKDFYINFFGVNKFGVSTWGKIYKKTLFNDLNIKTLGFNFIEDIIFNVQVFEKVNKVVFIKDFLYTHIYGGLSSQFNPIQVLEGYDKLYYFRLKFLERRNIINYKKYLLFELKNVLLHMCSKMIEHKFDFATFSQIIHNYKDKESYKSMFEFINDNEINLIHHNKEELLFKILTKKVKKHKFKSIIKKVFFNKYL